MAFVFVYTLFTAIVFVADAGRNNRNCAVLCEANTLNEYISSRVSSRWQYYTRDKQIFNTSEYHICHAIATI